jgi:aspartyl protease family protein
MVAWLLLAFLVIAGALLFFRGDVQVLSTMDNTEIAILAAGVLLIAVYVLILLNDEKSRPLRAVRYLLTWAAFGLMLVTSYAYRQELSGVIYRVAGELIPAGQTMVVESEDKSERAVRVRRRFDGHFSVRATVNGEAMLLLVDTGATTVVLKPAPCKPRTGSPMRLRCTCARSPSGRSSCTTSMRWWRGPEALTRTCSV